MNQYSMEQALLILSIISWGFYYTKSLKFNQVRGWYNYSNYTGGTVITAIRNSSSLSLPHKIILRIAMKNFTSRILLLIVLAVFSKNSAQAQSVLNPADSVYDYDSLHKPVQPQYGQIGKWVRTPRTYFGWNTNSYKCYIYKGIPFRIKFPKSYNPTANDGKKYPMLVFWHGLGETGETIYDNEFHLWLGCKGFRDMVDGGWFDGYVIAMQSQTALSGFFGSSFLQGMKELIDYMVVNNKLDPFQVIDNGLSSGGIATLNMLIDNPTYINGSIAMSPPGNYTSPDILSKVKFTPIWYINGGLDANPTPGTADYNKSIMDSAGAQFRRTTYPYNYHNTWDNTWIEPDFLPFLLRAYASNPWPLYNKTEYWPGQTVNTTIGLAPGFEAYEWRKDGVLIPGANSNTIQATNLGTYSARVMRNGLWSEWSRIPVVIKAVAGPPTLVEAENYSAMFGIQTEPTTDFSGGLNVAWQDNNDWMDYNVNLPLSGSYQVNFRVAGQFWGAQFQLRKSDGTILTTVTVPQTGNFQFWTTVSATVSLPAGQQTLRIYTSQANGGWNLNWIEFKPQGGPVELPPPGNQLPVANAGNPQTITLPASSVSLTGTGSDADGTIAGYSWTQLSGPNTASITSSNSASTGVSGLVQGTYVFRLTVTDNQNATGISDVTITVNAAPPPPSSSIRIEAENYSAMSGIQTESANDVGGGLDVGWQDNNDWMD
ncbi:MAG: carbohydrate-binding protein, partial [Flavisolibacter sp.]